MGMIQEKGCLFVGSNGIPKPSVWGMVIIWVTAFIGRKGVVVPPLNAYKSHWFNGCALFGTTNWIQVTMCRIIVYTLREVKALEFIGPSRRVEVDSSNFLHTGIEAITPYRRRTG